MLLFKYGTSCCYHSSREKNESDRVRSFYYTAAHGDEPTRTGAAKVCSYLGYWRNTHCFLFSIGMKRVHTASGTANVPIYLVNVVLLPLNVQIPNLEVTAAKLTGCDVLIGMDIITQGDFAITNVEGKTCMSFRIFGERNRFYFRRAPVQS